MPNTIKPEKQYPIIDRKNQQCSLFQSRIHDYRIGCRCLARYGLAYPNGSNLLTYANSKKNRWKNRTHSRNYPALPKYLFYTSSAADIRGYYSYLWSEVLDADAFQPFVEKGIFHRETAQSFRENILSKGGSDEPMHLYIRYRGAEPNPIYMLKNRGFVK